MNRARLPARRRSETYAPKLGAHRVHITIGRYADGRVGEVWIDLHKTGAPLRGMGHAIGRLASMALQAGTPVDVVARALVGVDGGPEGDVADCDGVTHASSVADLVGQVLLVASEGAR